VLAEADLLDINWWHLHVEYLANVYQTKVGKSWCIPDRGSGILYVKTPKTASSTATAITIQIAENVAQRESLDLRCKVWIMHNMNRNPDRSIMWTTLRDPARRALSDLWAGVDNRLACGPTGRDQAVHES